MEAVIVGDSMLKYIDKCMPEINVCCRPGALIRNLLPVLKEKNLLNNKTKCIIIHAGTNNMSISDMSVSSCIAEMRELCCSIQEYCTEVKIAISGVVFSKNWQLCNVTGRC